MNKCLYCYKDLNNEIDFHKKCSLAFFGVKLAPLLPYTLNQMSDLAKNVVERSISIPGVQAKLSMSIISKAIVNDSRLTIVGALGGNYIFKPPSPDFQEMPQNEHLSMCIAKTLGIKVVPSSLIRLQSGELSYITKRIDRTNNGDKIHMVDMFQIIDAFDKYKSSMEKIGKALDEYSDNTLLDKLYFFELAIFSFLIGNNDMHLKNFSMIQTDYGWSLSPAYDLLNVSILNPDDKEELALTMVGKKNKLNKKHFVQFGESIGLSSKQINGVFNRFIKTKNKIFLLIESSFLSKDMKLQFTNTIYQRFARLYG
ncbi:MAG: type II toxin-antitoxin system HipA family toxin [Bacteroidales bacterium]|nr:type II toxin-antitoxin system HipA family toxin [Bacteroidales bacterium]